MSTLSVSVFVVLSSPMVLIALALSVYCSLSLSFMGTFLWSFVMRKGVPSSPFVPNVHPGLFV